MLLLSLMSKHPNSPLSSWLRIIPGLKKLINLRNEADFEIVVSDRILSAIDLLERNALNFNNLDEETLSAILAGYIECPGISVEQESYSNGHVDIKILTQNIGYNLFRLAEAKKYHGPTYHEKGMQQLIGRYSSGSNPVAYMFSYVTTTQFMTAINSIKNHLDTNRPLNQVSQSTQGMHNSLVSVHNHASGQMVTLKHYNINLN